MTRLLIGAFAIGALSSAGIAYHFREQVAPREEPAPAPTPADTASTLWHAGAAACLDSGGAWVQWFHDGDLHGQCQRVENLGVKPVVAWRRK